MKLLQIIFLIVFFLSSSLFSNEIKVIELHSKPDNSITQNTNNENENDEEEIQAIDDLLFNNNDESVINENSNETISSVEDEVLQENVEDEVLQENIESSLIISVPDYWEKSKKSDLEFLFDNIKTSNSKVITSYFVDILSEFSNVPQSYSKAEFDNLRIRTLVKMGQRENALKVLNNIDTQESYKNYYNNLKLDYYLASDNLSEACNFKDSLQESLDDKNNNILKISIFCAFIQNQPEEADFLNSLLIDLQDKDDYFQKIYFNLKNNINDSVEFPQSLDESSLALYTAMLKIGNLPFNEKFLEFDPINLSLPIINSSYTDISLRLKSAHKAYDLDLFDSKSLSRLYRRVRFST